MQKIVKCNPVDTAEGKFNLVEVVLKGDALRHWLEFKQVEVANMSKNPMVWILRCWKYVIQLFQFVFKS
eukprot:14397839-Ditylum_brightwellii.AAC.1